MLHRCASWRFWPASKLSAVRAAGLSRLSAVTVKVDGKVYRLLAGRKLTCVPHGPDKGVRIFFSGEDLVLAHKRCNFWRRLRRRLRQVRGKLEGVWPGCTATRTRKDEVGKLAVRGWLPSVKRKLSMPELGRQARGEAVHLVQSGVINGKDGCLNREVLRPCIADACSAKGLSERRFCAASFYLQSRRCARHHKPLSGGIEGGCPPKAVAAKRGFVLDSSNRCVPPKECECLNKLCLDRMPRKKVSEVATLARRCKRYPEHSQDQSCSRANYLQRRRAQTGKRIVQYRETHGKHRCLRRVTRVSKKCPCPPSGQLKGCQQPSKCVKHTELVRVTKVFKAAEKCTKCKRITRRQVNARADEPFSRSARPGRKHRKKLVYTKQARNCKCIWKLAKEHNLLCYCSKKRIV
uniref:VWFD domain-containing protein n=1 Tax=Macrostomum lignano TaxID=282301 RepID=A0A1I8FCP1_9PLAT